MKVTLLNHSPNPEKIIAAAARLCYTSKDIDELLEGLTEEKVNTFIDKLTALGHESPLEHITFTFGVEGISRACSHQLVRHRMASYSQKSQRYVKEKDFDYVIPESIQDFSTDWKLDVDFDDGIKGYCESHLDYEGLMSIISSWYEQALRAGIPEEDARYVLPNACTTSIIVTMNIRSLFNFFKLRVCNRAQWEIRELAREMLKLCKEISPKLFSNAGPGCVRGACTEGSMSCGEPIKDLI